MTSAVDVEAAVDALADATVAAGQQRYFKTGPGDYGEGDRFVGVKVPPLRKIAREARALDLAEIAVLLESPVHEHRTVAVVILAERAKRADPAEARQLYDFYLAHTDRINNWDLVDISCRDVVGRYLLASGQPELLEPLARSDSLWERRIAMISTWTFIRAGDTAPTFRLAEELLHDPHDLIHKAVGWMLREAGQIDPARLDQFLTKHAAEMPRTALRYAIEKMPKDVRDRWRSL